MENKDARNFSGRSPDLGHMDVQSQSGWPPSGDMPWWEILDDSSRSLTLLNGVELANLDERIFAWVTPEDLSDVNHSGEAIADSLPSFGLLSPGNVLAVRTERVHAKACINSIGGRQGASLLGVSRVTYSSMRTGP